MCTILTATCYTCIVAYFEVGSADVASSYMSSPSSSSIIDSVGIMGGRLGSAVWVRGQVNEREGGRERRRREGGKREMVKEMPIE